MKKVATMIAICILVALAKPSTAQAEVWHCASQENCIGALRWNGAVLLRNGVVKGTITQTGGGPGTLSISEGWIIVTRQMDVNIYLYHIETGNRCDAFVADECYEGVVAIHPTDPSLDYAFVACPQFEQIYKISLANCSNIFTVSSLGVGPRSITRCGNNICVLNNIEGTIRYFDPWASSSDHVSTGYSNITSIGSTSNLVFINVGDNVYTKDIPLQLGNANLFYSFPAGTGAGEMKVTPTHILMASTSPANAFLVEIANPNSHVTLPVPNPGSVAISGDTTYVIKTGALPAIHAFDFSGNAKSYSPISEDAISLAYAAPTLPPYCGNDLAEPGELCDGTDFDGADCTDYGFGGGQLGCDAFCGQVSTVNCWSCGDGDLNPGEECDGSNFGSATCANYGHAEGDLICTSSCTIDQSECYTCGDGFLNGPEECDSDIGSTTCESQGFVGGTLSCGANCFFDTSQCHNCGNDVIDDGEFCDGSNTGNALCQTLGYDSGTLLCNSTCDDYDTSQCYECGDGVVNGTEECDLADLGGANCSSIDLGFTQGTLACYGNCTYNTSGCTSESCGNGTVDPGEDCDDGANNSDTISGACRTNCRFPSCGDGVIDPLEQCDDGDRASGDGCDENCQYEIATCGNGTIESGEACDGTDLNGQTCESLGYVSGVLYCNANCSYNTSDCQISTAFEEVNIDWNVAPQTGDLLGSLAAQYSQNVQSANPSCEWSEINGDLLITAPLGTYCNVEISSKSEPQDRVFIHLYSPENRLGDEDPFIRFYQDGRIVCSYVGAIKSYRGLLLSIILGNNEFSETPEENSAVGLKALSVHPENETEGRWLEILVEKGSMRYCMVADPANCGSLEAPAYRIVDLDNPTFKTSTKSKSGCSVAGRASETILPVILLVAIMWLLPFARRRRKHS